MSAKFYVYLLLDPRKEYIPFYVGKGCGNRASSHSWEGKTQKQDNAFKYKTIQAIKKAGFEVAIQYWACQLEEDAAYNLETELICRFGRRNIDEGGILTNVCLDNRPPSALGRPVSPETREKIAAKQRGELNHRHGKVWEDEQKELRRQFNIDNGIKPPVQSGPMSDEQKAAIGAGNRGKKRTPEQCAELSKQRRGRPRKTPTSDETKAKIRAANIAAKNTPEAIARREALAADPEHRARLSASIKAAWARRKTAQ